MEIQIDKAVRRFREFLNSSWAAVSASEMEQDVFGDWLQANFDLDDPDGNGNGADAWKSGPAPLGNEDST